MTRSHPAHPGPRQALRRRPLPIAVALALALAGTGAGSGVGQAQPPASLRSGHPAQGQALVEHWQAGRHGERGYPDPKPTMVENCNDSGPGSLREAVAGVDRHAILDMTQLTCSRITLTTGAIVLPELGTHHWQFRLRGPGRDLLTIDAGHASPVFVGGNNNQLIIKDLTITGGRHVGSVLAAGGCIAMSTGDAYLYRSRIHDCHVESDGIALGGAVSAKNVLSDDSQWTGNSATGRTLARGGAAASKYVFSAGQSTVSGNSVQVQAPGPDQSLISGGGAVASKYLMMVFDSVISGNSAQADAGPVGGGGLLGPNLISAAVRLSDNSVITGAGTAVGGGLCLEPPGQPPQSSLSPAQLAGLPGFGGIQAWLDGDLPPASGNGFRSRISGINGDLAGATDSKYGIQLQQSQISGNQAASGGGIGGHGFDGQQSGYLLIQNSTLSGNQATRTDAAGGGALALSGGGDLSLVASTIAGNSGGGIVIDGIAGTEQALSAVNTLIAGNDDGDVIATWPVTVAGGYNLVRSWDPANVTLPADTLNADPLLQPLAANGGWHALTHALPANSPARDAGLSTLLPANMSYDQRSWPFLRVVGEVDIGAFEYSDTLFANSFQPLVL